MSACNPNRQQWWASDWQMSINGIPELQKYDAAVNCAWGANVKAIG